MKRIIYPTPEEVTKYLRHGSTAMGVQGLENGILMLDPFYERIPKDNELMRPKVFWTKGDFTPNSDPRIMVASTGLYYHKRSSVKMDLGDGLLFEISDELPDGIEFFKGFRCMPQRIGIVPYFKPEPKDK